jgi:hypothetical protein
MGTLARAFLDVFGPPLEVDQSDEWKITCARPLLKRLDQFGPGWHPEDDVCGGDVHMSIIGARCFVAKELGLIDYKQRFLRSGWWIRLTLKGQRFLREQTE